VRCADEAQEADEEDELEAMFKPKKKRKQQLELAERKAAVESTLARMEVPMPAMQSLTAAPYASIGTWVPHLHSLHPSQPADKRTKALDLSQVAAELDIEANTNRRPAVHKLQELPEVEQVKHNSM